MIKIIRAIGFGVILGATLFFAPFVFKYMLVALFVAMAFRMIFFGNRSRFVKYYDHESGYEPIVPIDGYSFTTNLKGTHSLHNVEINY
ncbi:hypothetical protein ACJVDH_20785 [Pedobacter sp. AW1-32]|uniref:hypothetical protein n=1 Tax=Pedobacter sp. AW1-32 TaxID=3383026 RepID=UPI003FEE9092